MNIHVFKSPGTYLIKGRTYKMASVASQQDLQAHLDDGWKMTVREAIESWSAPDRRADWRKRKAMDAKIRAQRIKERAEALAAHAQRKANKPALPETLAPVDEKSPPTREEMEQQATLLGLKFDRRTSDRRLLERINEAMKGA